LFELSPIEFGDFLEAVWVGEDVEAICHVELLVAHLSDVEDYWLVGGLLLAGLLELEDLHQLLVLH